MVDITNIKRLAKEIETKYDLNYYEILQRYMFERILERISVSNYQDNFILKTLKDKETNISNLKSHKYFKVETITLNLWLFFCYKIIFNAYN